MVDLVKNPSQVSKLFNFPELNDIIEFKLDCLENEILVLSSNGLLKGNKKNSIFKLRTKSNFSIKIDDQEFTVFDVSPEQNHLIVASSFTDLKKKSHNIIEVWNHVGGGIIKFGTELDFSLSSDSQGNKGKGGNHFSSKE